MPDDKPTASSTPTEGLTSEAPSTCSSKGTWSLEHIGASSPLDLSLLTSQQRNVLRLFIKEPDEARVAKQLGIKKQSVYNALTDIQHRLRIRCRAELMKRVILTLVEERHEHRREG